LTRFAVEKIVSDISDRAYRLTGKRVTPHIFRHTTATVALQAGMPVQNVSRMLGHERIETTMIYAEINNNDVQRDHLKYVV
jgi:site-specific recombinase XerD